MQQATLNHETQPLSTVGAATLLAVACLTIMVGCAIVPALPSIALALGVEHSSSWLVTLPSLGVVLFAPLAGRIIDTFGAHRSLCAGLALYGILGLAPIILPNPAAVFAGRTLLGGATAVVMSSGTSLISQFYSGPARMRMIARQGMAIELGGVVFLFIGGILAKMGWIPPFFLYATAFLFLIMVLAFVPSPTREKAAETTGQPPFPYRSLRLVYGAALLSMATFFTAVLALPFRLAALQPHSFSESEVGLFLAFASLVAVAAAALTPTLVKHLREITVLSAAFALYAAAHACFALGSTIPIMIFGAICLGSGFGFSVPLVNHMTVERTVPAQRGRGLAHLSMAIFLGQFLSSFTQFIPGGQQAMFITASLGSAIIAFAYLIRARS